jgi:hypothetical protein
MTTPESRPTPPNPDWPAEFDRLTMVSSVVNAVSHHVSDLTPVSANNLPRWLTRLALPPEWRLAHLAGNPPPPTRIAVYGQRPDGGWKGCETISVFRFTGTLSADVVHDNADCTLRDLNAEGITTVALATPPTPGATAVRSRGYFTAGERRVWAQYSIYVAGTNTPGQGMLVDQALFIEARYRRRGLWGDIDQLGNAIHIPFLTLHRRMYEVAEPSPTPPVRS